MLFWLPELKYSNIKVSRSNGDLDNKHDCRRFRLVVSLQDWGIGIDYQSY